MSTNGRLNIWKLLGAISLPIFATAAIYFITRKKKYQFRLKQSASKKKFVIVEADDTNVDPTEAPHPPGAWTALGLEQPVVIAMVGLPARGKSYIVKMIIRYLKWTGFECDVFNVGSYRRKIGLQSADSNFFSAGNKDAQRVREEMAMAVQEMMYSWLHESGSAKCRVAIFDATNTTKDRRLALAQKAREENVQLIFVESICDDREVLQRNYEMKLNNDDYKGMDPNKALKDFMGRVEAYERVYQTIEDDEDSNQISYIKLINVGQKVITRNCTGYLPSQVAFYLQNVHISPRRIYLSLTSESGDLVEDTGRLPPSLASSDTGRLTETGREYSRDLARYLQAQHQESTVLDTTCLGKELLVLAGTAKIHAETLLHLRMLFSCYNTPLLNELRGGDLHNLSKEEIKARFPKEYGNRTADKLKYRYPGVGGESYLDVIERIRPVIIELERQRRSVAVVCHLAVLRCIYGYFMGTSVEDIPYKPFKRHVIYELTPGPFGCTCREINPTEELAHI